ncbi:MAG: GntR family transcriptional regulator [Solirubrobacteraceae bacterium]
MTLGSDDVLFDVAIDRHGEVPIGVQLAWALRARIGDGRLRPGERLPGLRELAEALGINANTARAVYQRLEQEGLIESRQGTGTFVTQSGDGRSAQAGQIAADAAERAQSTGVDPREVAAALYVAVPGAESDAGPVATAAAQTQGNTRERRRVLRGQIAALEQTLSELQMHDPSLIPAPSEPTRRAGPRLLSVADLEEIRTDLLHRLAEPLLQAAPATQDDRAKAQTAKKKPSAKSAHSAAAQPALHSPVPTIRPAPAST